ncbi:MAG TPA: MFS transporter [Thermoplasmata archaeon]|nr:MFS transporter [Thermoplasmata archaeon]
MVRWNTGKVLLATMLGTMDTNALVPVIALYAASRGADILQVGIIVGLYSAVHAPANLLFGRVVDRWGRRRPLTIGLLWDGVSLFLYALAGNPLQLALVRMSHGFGGGLVGPSTMSLISDASSSERKGRAMALYGMSIAIAVVLGFGIAGPIVHRFDYPALFALLGLGLLVGTVVSATIREPARARATATLVGERLASYLRRREVVAGYCSIFGLYFALGAFTALVPLFLQASLGYGPLEVGLSFFVFALLSLLLHYPAGILSDRFGSAVPAFLGLLAISAAMALIPLARDSASVFLLMGLFGVGHGFVFPSSSALVTRGAAGETTGVVTGLFYAVLVGGVALGAPIMAAVAFPSNYALGIWGSAWVPLLALVPVLLVLVGSASSKGARPASTVTNESGDP